MTENEKYQIIKKLVDTNGNKDATAFKIGYIKRHIYRLIAGYKSSIKAFFIHGNHSHNPATTIPDHTKQLILNLYKSKYSVCNLTHFRELLLKTEGISISTSSISTLLRTDFVLSPKTHRNGVS